MLSGSRTPWRESPDARVRPRALAGALDDEFVGEVDGFFEARTDGTGE